jgi:CubicO group peptidase (beta-lactamase class C family)
MNPETKQNLKIIFKILSNKLLKSKKAHFFIACTVVFMISMVSVGFENKKNLPSKNKEKVLKNTVKDSMMVTIPYEVNFTNLDAFYKDDKSCLIDKFYKQNFAESTYSGSFLVAKNGTILFEDYTGYSNTKAKSKIEQYTPLHVASVSKVMTAAAIMRLAATNQIQLDEKVQYYLEDFPYTETTVRGLLNHRSGLQHYKRFGEFIKGWNHKKVLSNQDVLDYYKKYKFRLIFKNDSKFNYNNSNYALLALIVEEITKKTFPVAMQELVFAPLDMQNSFIIDFKTQKDSVSQSYKANGYNYGWDQFDAIYGDKNLYTTPRDLLKFDIATYSDEFLSLSLKEEMLKGYSYESDGINNYGLGIRMKEYQSGEKIHYHNGWWHGNTSSYVTLKKDTVTIIAISNRYSKKPYQVMKLASIFGTYPFEAF